MEAASRVSEAERIAIVDLADDLQVRKQRIFKILRRLGIRPTQRRDARRGNQNVELAEKVMSERPNLQ
jgi:phage antirepressor YoqD-like protein